MGRGRRGVRRDGSDAGDDGADLGDRTGAEVVAVREPAGHNDRVDAFRALVAVPQQLGIAAELLDRELHIELAVRARKDDDTDTRGHEMTTS